MKPDRSQREHVGQTCQSAGSSQQAETAVPQIVSDAELEEALGEILNSRPPHGRRIQRLDRRPSQYHSSFPLEDLAVVFDNGERIELVFKNVNPRALSAAARRAKPEFLDDPLREIEVYRHILSSAAIGTPAYYGSVIDQAADRYWLFLEKVEGQELYQVGDFNIWKQAARWLAEFHQRFAEVDRLPRQTTEHLVRYDASYYRRWIDRAVSFFSDAATAGRVAEIRDLRRLEQCYPQLVRELLQLPVTLIHGEFYASNVLIQEQERSPSLRVSPVDWERAAVGPGLIDLAALVAGNWTEHQKQEMALEYYAALREIGGTVAAPDVFLRGLRLCRLHLAVQWLGWSREWSPPGEHRQDWFAEAVENARSLGF